MISRPTFEEAPLESRLWLKQRTRWLKGWLQTSLVHTRHPVRLIREIGWRQAIGFLLTGFGAVVAAALYPVYFATTLALVLNPPLAWNDASPLRSAVIALNVFNFFAGYCVFGVLVVAAYRLRGEKRPRGALRFLPAYWILLALACYRALLQLVLAPHRWEKTKHVGRVSPRRRPRSKPLQQLAASPTVSN
jgi:hypothetical protein